jgi:hypothetical protein
MFQLLSFEGHPMQAAPWQDQGPSTTPATAETYMTIEISSAISSFSTAVGLLRGALNARDEGKIKEALTDMTSRLFTISEQGAKLAMENEELKAQIRELQEQAAERERFVLHEVRPGAFVLRFEPTSDDKTPVHYACQACRGLGRKVVLRLDHRTLGTELSCPADQRHDIYVGQDGAAGLVR